MKGLHEKFFKNLVDERLHYHKIINEAVNNVSDKSQEKTLYDYIYSYWSRFSLHLERSLEATQYLHTWTAFQIGTTYEKTKYKNLGFRKDNEYIN